MFVALSIAGAWGVFWFPRRGRELAAFLSSSAFLFGLVATALAGNYPNWLRSTLDPSFSLTASNSASAHYGLGAALAWWGVGIALVAAYFTNLFRMMRGKSRSRSRPIPSRLSESSARLFAVAAEASSVLRAKDDPMSIDPRGLEPRICRGRFTAAVDESHVGKRVNAPPFNLITATQKVRAAEDAWNSRDPHRVSLAYSEDSVWRNRSQFVTGRDEIRRFLADKWVRELDYRLTKDLWAFHDNRIAVRFQYEWRDAAGRWWRSYGNELWEFDEHGLMRRREASINDVEIGEHGRRFFWPAPGPRPVDHPGIPEVQ